MPRADRRSVCIWAGTLASWRPGLIKGLVRACGSVSAVLDRRPEEIAALVPLRAPATPADDDAPARRSATGPTDAARPPGDGASERAHFEAALRLHPDDCARAADTAVRGGRVVAWCDPLYPPALRHIADAPLCLFVRAACPSAELDRRLEALAQLPVVAVVGTRAPSPYGEEMAVLLGRDLTLRGALVVSGMAMGVDAVAQRAAVTAAGGRRPPATVGVLGCGADLVYPRVNGPLFADVLRHGLILSEFAWGVPARAWRFPARNRVMAALSRAVVVVEGAARSGTLLTAAHAVETGREVLAVPGEAGRRLSVAPHRLLRLGAGLCESAEDVFEAIGACAPPPAAGDGRGDVPGPALRWSDGGVGPLSVVLRLLADGPMTADQLASRGGLTAARAAAAVSELEVDGVVRRDAGGRYRLERR